MFQNMQIFEKHEKNREGFTKEWFLHFLQIKQSSTFIKSDGIICLSDYAWNYLQLYYPKLLHTKNVKIIPHGINNNLSKKVTHLIKLLRYFMFPP